MEPLASETLGVRSMSVRIGSIVIDPSASLAPRRYGLPPHPVEWEALVDAVKRIVKALERAEVVVITHYHRDHYNPGWLYDNSILDGKTLLIKDYKKNINVSQKIRAYKFLKEIKDLNVKVEIADSREFELGDYKITFSPPLPHGKDEKLGYVLAVQINDILYSSDVQGGPLKEHDWLLERDAKVLLLDGPPLYLRGFEIGREKEFIHSFKGEVVVDHHSARSLDWRERLEVSKAYNDLLGVEEKLLEARRKELYQEKPVEDSWLKMKFREMRELYLPLK
ncbi:hypothetical protein IPA_07925 [Ignicoccus pacificus DSM 13166]|uniref:UPF0282 protein IPA_07925 n=1 Tax=Ignicoccus pacificus DSM 13166 TaxID=940294 RepID=A0A977K9Z7_9CREN|nr:hypothetical protein IPA_07925 [Ignicoccus pacificus DSM 13166]